MYRPARCLPIVPNHDLNSLYARFDSRDFGYDRDRLKQALTEAAKNLAEEGIVVHSDDVLSVLKKTKPYKAAGPDGVATRVLNKCADQLVNILCYIFNLSLTHCCVPAP